MENIHLIELTVSIVVLLIILLNNVNIFVEELVAKLTANGCMSLGESLFESAKLMLMTSLVVAFLSLSQGRRDVQQSIENARSWIEKAEYIHPMIPYPIFL